LVLTVDDRGQYRRWRGHCRRLAWAVAMMA